MLGEKGKIRQRSILGQTQGLGGVGDETLRHSPLRHFSLQPFRDQEAQVVIKGDQPATKFTKLRNVADRLSPDRLHTAQSAGW